MELALIENLQRKDLTAFEEAEALQQLAQKCRYTHEDMARKLGKSRTSITESLSLNNMPDEVRNLCRLADITSKSTLLQIVRQADPKKMLALVEKMAAQGARDAAGCPGGDRQAERRAGRGRSSSRSSRPTKTFQPRMSFKKGRVDKAEIIEALENIIRELKAAGRQLGSVGLARGRDTAARVSDARSRSRGTSLGPAVGYFISVA